MFNFPLFLTSGSEKLRPYWKQYYKGAQAVIYVVNAACDEEGLKTSKDALHEALCDRQLRGLPLLVLANCQDKEGARSAKQVSVLEVSLHLTHYYNTVSIRERCQYSQCIL